MVNQRRYKRGKITHRRKTGQVKRSRVKRSRVKRTKMRGGGMGETGPEQITTFHEPNQLHNFSMTSRIPEGERVRPAGPGFSKREIKYLQKRKKKKNKKNKLIGKESNKIE